MKTYYEGTGVHITMVISKPTATCTITIEDSCDVVIVDEGAMTKTSDYVYTYTYQSSTAGNEGDWLLTFKVTYGAFTAVSQDKIVFQKQENT